MKALIKAEIIRLYKNKLFLGGNTLAFLITVGFCKYLNMVRPSQSEIHNIYANFISLGIMAFSSLFTALFIGEQYMGGVIRNKVIAGHKQTTIYVSSMIAIFVGVLTTTGCWFAGCLVAGYYLESYTLKFVLILLFAAIAYAGILTTVAMRVKNTTMGCGITMGIFFVSYVAATGVHAAYVWAEEGTGMIWKVLLDVMPMGQWFAIFARDGAELPLTVMLLLSSMLTILAYLAGTVGLNKRELK